LFNIFNVIILDIIIFLQNELADVKMQTLRAMERYFTLASDVMEEGKKNKATLSQSFADIVDIMGNALLVYMKMLFILSAIWD